MLFFYQPILGGTIMESLFIKLAKYPIIETERLVLRPVTLDDAEAMFEYASNQENTRYPFPPVLVIGDVGLVCCF